MPYMPADDFITVRDLKFHYRRWSAESPAPHLPPIVLIHGLASAAHIWDLVAPLLAEQGYVVTALDQRGHGESDKPDTGYEFASIIADDAAILQTLKIERPILVGHSWGAAVTLEYAATYPDAITALVLVDGATNQLSLRPGWSREQAMQDLAPPRFAGTPRDLFLSYMQKGPLGQQWTPELEEIALHIVQLRADNTVAPRLAFENHLQIIGAMWDQPTFELYIPIRCPITLVVAEAAPSAARSDFVQMRLTGLQHIQEIKPAVSIIHMPDTIHDVPLQRPQELAQLIMRAG